MQDKIIVKGARENNLKNIDIEIPKNSLVVMTGLSGSGKSSLAFDTIYQEGQRRYVESLSAYARQFLGNSEKPQVDSIEGLSPAISIEQKTTNRNPRSTVGTVTEIYDYLRLLFARIGTPYCPTHKIPITAQSIDQIINKILELKEDTRIQILSPVVSREKGTHQKLYEELKMDGYVRVRVNGETLDLDNFPKLEKNKKHSIEVIIDRIKMKEDIRSRLTDSVETALKLSKGKVIVHLIDTDEEMLFSETYACPECDFSIPELEPRLFSFNNPLGACPNCNGLGTMLKIDRDLVVPNPNLTLNEGAIHPYRNSDEDSIMISRIKTIADYYGLDMDTPVKDLDQKKFDYILYGTPEVIDYELVSKSSGKTYPRSEQIEGIITNLERRYLETTSQWSRTWIEGYMRDHNCEVCSGTRLQPSVLNVLINGKSIHDVTTMPIEEIKSFMDHLDLTEEQAQISELVLKEVIERTGFLVNVGLEYLTLARSAGTLSGGEAQRIRLATQIGSRLTGVLYVLDEPSIGLHQRDNERLINTLIDMKQLGNTLIVVEHDEDTMRACDYLIDIGPRAGVHGGEVVAAGTPEEVMKNDNSITGKYLSGKEFIEVPKQRRKIDKKKYVEIIGATENNLKDISVKIPLGVLNCVTGVSGSGKSTLVNEILYKGIHANLYKTKDLPGKHKEIIGMDQFESVIDISQSPIGRTPRSNPATYTGVFDHIRDLYTATNEAKARGYQKGRFSFNVKGGRCESCKGDGVKKISMHFLPDVYVPCEVCGGTKYNNETLEVKFKGKNIAEVLAMTVEDALEFFDSHPKIKDKLQTLYDVGLGYVTLGQSSTTLSGGEAQRVKLASELYKKITDKTLYILDEPTTGLHTDDVKRLIDVINRIVDENATVVVIEHNLDIIKVSDHIIDLGPEGGDKGGTIIIEGTPEEVAACNESYTGKFLRKVLK